MHSTRRSFAALAAALLACGGKTDETTVDSEPPCASCVDAAMDAADSNALDATTTDSRVMDSGAVDAIDAIDAVDAADTRDAIEDADACFHVSEDAVCCERSVYYGPELTKCPGVTCRVAYWCTSGHWYEDHDDCFFATCDTGVDTADTRDTADTLDASD